MYRHVNKLRTTLPTKEYKIKCIYVSEAVLSSVCISQLRTTLPTKKYKIKCIYVSEAVLSSVCISQLIYSTKFHAQMNLPVVELGA